ncbi:MAG: hypothetical protein AAB320_06030 [Elusimicrobiota bacterium]
MAHICALLVVGAAAAASPAPNELETLRRLEDEKRSVSGHPYWFPTSIVDSQAALRRPRSGDRAAAQEKADLLLKLGRFDLAEKAYKELLAGGLDDRTRVELWHGLAAAQFKQNGGEDLPSYRRARKTFKQAAAAKLPAGELRALSELGVCYSEWHVWLYGGQAPKGPVEAIAACGKALKIKTREETAAEVSEILAGVYLDSGAVELGRLYLDQAVSHLQAAARRGPSEALSFDIARLKGRLANIKSLD